MTFRYHIIMVYRVNVVKQINLFFKKAHFFLVLGPVNRIWEEKNGILNEKLWIDDLLLQLVCKSFRRNQPGCLHFYMMLFTCQHLKSSANIYEIAIYRAII